MARVSVSCWMNAIMSDSFMPQGKVSYNYELQCWVDEPNPNAKPISADQILKFFNTFTVNCDDAIDELIKDDGVIAAILYDKKNVIPEEESLGEVEFKFGGWDDNPEDIVAEAMEEAEIEGTMRAKSSFRKSYIGLDDGYIFWFVNGHKRTLMEVYKP
jgi:hypothetical protein